MAKKQILVSYNESNKLIKVSPSQTGTNLEVQILREECMKLFKFYSNVSLDIFFQKYDADWDAWIDIDDNYAFDSKEKLKVVVQPILSGTVKSTSESEVSFFF